MLQKISNKRFTFEIYINLSILKEEKYKKIWNIILSSTTSNNNNNNIYIF